jgi:siroheme synthase
VVHDRLGTERVLPLAHPRCELIDVGKAPGRHGMEQQDINELLVQLAARGLRVVRLKGGDPFIFGRGGEEALALADAGIAFEIVPGISSAIGGAGVNGIPLTHRAVAQSVTIASGHDDPTAPAAAARWSAHRSRPARSGGPRPRTSSASMRPCRRLPSSAPQPTLAIRPSS